MTLFAPSRVPPIKHDIEKTFFVVAMMQETPCDATTTAFASLLCSSHCTQALKFESSN
jgi:hypothetical protein